MTVRQFLYLALSTFLIIVASGVTPTGENGQEKKSDSIEVIVLADSQETAKKLRSKKLYYNHTYTFSPSFRLALEATTYIDLHTVPLYLKYKVLRI
jgi:hypothetical protein